MIKTALTIAGSDSCGGAGIQADLKTFQALGVYGMSAVTAVTVQNTQKVLAVTEMPPAIVRDQILCLFDDIAIDAVKIGMVSSIAVIEAIADALRQVERPPVVLDPVMISKSGCRLLRPDAQAALVKILFPLAHVVTPNLHEAAALVGQAVSDVNGMKAAARQILALGAGNVVIKGGHLLDEATDVVYDGQHELELHSPRVDTRNTHGTGCTFAAAIAAHLARGRPMFKAVRLAKNYITGAIKNALPIGKGYGPPNHFFELYAKAGVNFW